MTRATAAGSTAPLEDKDTLSRKVFLRAFEHSNEGMLITDSEKLIVAVNDALCRLSGYSPGELIGQNPRILSSGRATPEFYAALWQRLNTEDYWEGEIWNKQKDGANYLRCVKISVVRQTDGSIGNYVANFSEIEANHEVADRLAYLAYHDPLTNLPNRLAFESQLAQSLRSCERDGKQLALMLIDLDNFKNINDTLGHQVGDLLLQSVAQRLRECVRGSDLVARIGGDEFVVVLPEIEAPLTAARVASKIQSNLADSYRIADHVLYATPSIGISLYPIDGSDPGTLLRNADTAMYHAKNAGRNNHQFYTARMNEASGERLAMENELRQAIAAISPANAEFSLHFQPQIETVSGRVLGVEALLRWNSPKFGQVSPLRFIAIAEETGLIQPLGDWVIWETCRLIRLMKQQGIAGIRVAINISAQQLRHENLLLLVRGALACYDLQPEDIELEVTESTAMENPEMTLSILDQLAAMGIVLAIDDFGTGYSSLAYLKHLPIKRLKLDRSFVTDIETDVNDAAICTATIALGHSLGLELVAEGVETEAQRDFLAGLDCDFLQGYLYSRPMPFDDTVAYLKAHLATERR
ncbi:MAG: EAL domain-containing protein [Gammaproteobacteria bacterium]|nr:EAL domain-containing protein [Gammaproteobacteria bacterium]MBU1602419.1 EAL domain-containing protein [Gammaproteobacteria bacterium]MBU2433224.1 EAL domain-containing protein [Gammaproteobacteria bacterium]MBU2451140.1 EAL domain-containing protein [Gammaproteobacteria bacterium]